MIYSRKNGQGHEIMCDAAYHFNQALKYWTKLNTECLQAICGHSTIKNWTDSLADSMVENQLQTFRFLNTFFNSN
jgi:hypothetical protein